MLSTDIHMHTGTHDLSQKVPRRNKSHLTLDTERDSKADVMRTLDEFTSKFRKRASWLDSATFTATSHSSTTWRGRPEPVSTTYVSPRYLQEEPTTPEEQIFGGVNNQIMSTPNTAPELTPDNPFGGVTASTNTSSGRSMSGARRKPVHQDFFKGESPIKPLMLQGLNQTDAPLKFTAGDMCGFCDMSLATTFKSETAVRMLCGHVAHRECRDNLVRVCLEYGDEMLTCPICDGFVMTPDSNPKLLLASEFPYNKGEILSTKPAPFHSTATSNRLNLTGFDTHRPGINSPYSSPSVSSDKSQPETLAQILTPEIQAVAPKPVSKPPTGRRSLKDALASSVSSASSSLNSSLGGEPHSPKRPVSISSLFSETGNSVNASFNDPNLLSQSLIDSESGLYRHKVAELRRYDLTKSVKCETPSFTINATGYVSQMSDKESETSQVALWVQAPEVFDRDDLGQKQGKNVMLGSPYRTTAKDVQCGIKWRREVESLSYKGKPLSNVQHGILRLYSEIRVTSPDRELLDWPQTHAYLFEKYLILVTAPDNRVRAVLNATAAIGSVETHEDDPTVARLKPTDSKIPELHFHMESRSAVYMWVEAFEDLSAQFPLHPANCGTYLENKEMEIELNGGDSHLPASGRAPAEIVLCAPYRTVASNSVIQLAIKNIIAELQPCDTLALILYSSDGIEKCVTLQKPLWPGWKVVFDELRSVEGSQLEHLSEQRTMSNSLANAPSPAASSKPVRTFDQVISTIREVLENHSINKTAASVVLVSDDDTKLRALPKEFQSAKIPINCIGLTESHDALTLSTLARSTSGNYAYSKHVDGVGPLLAKLVKLETQYTTREVIVRLRSRINTKIENFRQPSLDDNISIKNSDEETRVVQWHLGKMRRGDVRSLVFDVRGKVPPNQPVVQISVDCVDALGIIKSSASFRVDAPSVQNENKDTSEEVSLPKSLLETECVLASSFKVFENVLALLITENNRRAFQSLSEGLSEVRTRLDNISGSNATDVVYRRMLEILAQLLDQRCDAIIEHKLLTRDFVLESLQQLWIFSSRRSLASRDSLERFYA